MPDASGQFRGISVPALPWVTTLTELAVCGACRSYYEPDSNTAEQSWWKPCVYCGVDTRLRVLRVEKD